MADSHKNFAASLVATAPSPATSGASLVVTTGDGALFPTAPFNATICPAGTQPTTANAEIVRVTAVATDTLTITRAQETTSARTVVVGDQIFAGITAQTLLDAETVGGVASQYAPTALPYESGAGRASGFNASGVTPTGGTLTMVGVWLPAGYPVGHLAFSSGSVAAVTPTHWWFSLHDSSRVMLAVTADQTSTAWAATTVKSLAVATIASGAAASFTTTYSGIHYVGFMMTAGTLVNLVNVAINNTLATTQTPALVGISSASLTTPPAFPFTAAALTATSSLYWAGVGA